MSAPRKKFFKKSSNSVSSMSSKSTKRELKFAPLDPRGFVTQSTYQQVKDALIVMIDEKIEYDQLDIRSCIEKEVIIRPHEPVEEQPKGLSPEAIEDFKERNKILYESAPKKWDKRMDNLDKNLLKVCSMI